MSILKWMTAYCGTALVCVGVGFFQSVWTSETGAFTRFGAALSWGGFVMLCALILVVFLTLIIAVRGIKD